MSDINWNQKDLGPVDAYALAVEGGYTGTKEQFETDMGNSATNATTATTKAAEAAQWATGGTTGTPSATNNAKAYSQDAEAYAIGKRGGVDVTSGDPAYHNSAIYYKTAAETAAASASAAYNTSLLAPNYSSESTYKVGDHVIYSGAYYECVSAISTAEAWTAAHWKQVTVGGENSDLKSALNVIRDGTKNLFHIDQFTGIKPLKTTVTMGERSVRVVTNGESYTGAGYAFAELKTGIQYTVSADVVVNSGAASIVYERSADGITWGTASNIFTNKTESGHYSGTFWTHATDKYYRLSLLDTWSGTSGDVVFSNIQLEEGTTETAFVDSYTAKDITARAGVAKLNSDLEDTNDKMNDLKDDTLYFDVADGELSGKLNSNTTSIVSILPSDSPYIDDTSRAQNVKKVEVRSKKVQKAQKKDYTQKRIVAINHDDLLPSDYLSVRKIYNKYGFNGNFNFILQPFKTETEMNTMIANVKALIRDGNTLGLHAIGQESAWIINPLMDVMPVTPWFTFAPSRSEIQTVVADGKNVFGYTISATTTIPQAGFVAPISNYNNTKVLEMSVADYVTMMTGFSVWMNPTTMTGLDLDGNSQTWTLCKWLEYWYNELIDNTLGYSNTNTSSGTRFASDYDVPSGASAADYYPDATHLLNGKIVFFDDTSNPHYSDSDYQKVGRFNKGILKGCASSCNGEIIDRLIMIAKAFLKHYFDIDNLTYFNRHGGRFYEVYWLNDEYVPFQNRGKTVLAGLFGKSYHSRSGKFLSGFDHLKDAGIRVTGHDGLMTTAVFEGQVGLYYGQTGVRSPFFNAIEKINGDINYLAAIAPSSSYDWNNISKEKFDATYAGVDNWIKFTYEKAGQTVNGMYVLDFVKKFIDRVNRCAETGKIPCFSYDTVVNDASCLTAFEMICQYCYDNNIALVPMEYARLMATDNDRDYKKNLIPNPTFKQSLLRYFGGSSTSDDAYIPDGWGVGEGNSSDSYCVVSHSNNVHSLTVKNDNSHYAYFTTRLYGLCAGNYKLKFNAKKGTNTSGAAVGVFLKKNSDFVLRYYGRGNVANFDYAARQIATTTDTAYELTFTIPEPTLVKQESSDWQDQLCNGYEDNVMCVVIELYTNGELKVHDVSLELM